MTEQEYITLSNRIHASAALQNVREMLPDFDGVITKEERQQVLEILSKWEEQLFKAVKVRGKEATKKARIKPPAPSA